MIKKIPICCTTGTDRRIWPLNSQGDYTVKSGYHCLKQEQPIIQPHRASSSHVVDPQVWKIIWSMNAPNKIKNFLWKSCCNIVATLSNLSKKHVVASALCPICLSVEESVEHMLLGCEWTRCVWFECCSCMHVDKDSLVTFDQWLLQVLLSSNLDRDGRSHLLTVIGFICWGLWKTRCNIVLSKSLLNVQDTILRINAAITEFLFLKTTPSANATTQLASHQEEVGWQSPPQGWIKINCDGSFKPDSHQASVGVVLRDHDGKLTDGLHKLINADSPLVAEATAVKEGVKLAAQKNISKVIIETDSAVLHADLINPHKSGKWKIWSLVKEIRETARQIPHLQFSCVRRNANQVADWIASRTNTGKCPQNWVNHPPSSLVHVLKNDGLPAPPINFVYSGR